MLLGDFNINWSSISTPRNILSNSLATCNLTPLQLDPTHHRGESHSTIDYFCVSDTSRVLSLTQSQAPSISDHDILSVLLSFPGPPASKPRAITCRSYRYFNRAQFLNDLSSHDWGRVMNFKHVDEKVKFFTTSMRGLYDKHAPYRTFYPKRKPSPWLTPEISNLIRARNKAWKTYRRFGRSDDRAAYKHLRNRVKTLSRNALSAHYKNRLARCTSSTDLWKCVGELGVVQKDKGEAPLAFEVDDINRHFIGSSSPPLLTDSRPTARITPDKRFFFQHVEARDVIDAVMAARSNARGIDDIPLSFVKECLHVVLPVLLNIFDTSLQAGVFPSLWKKAVVLPLPKRHPPSKIEDFRPISILCSPSKILEAVAHKQIIKFIENSDILDPLQSGFRKRHSTHTALLKIVDDLRGATDAEKITLLAAIDFSRAFDLVNCALLVKKLKALGFSDSACEWIRSFLSDRSQSVRSPSGETSDWLPRNAGVPQGSILGPLLFALFINDASSVCKHCKYHLYADDFTIYCHGSFQDARLIVEKVNEDLAALAAWADANGLVINAEKTKAIWFGSRGFMSKLHCLPPPLPSMNDQPIEYCDSIKLLGVLLDSTLSFGPMTIETSRKCHAALSRLRKCQDFIPPSAKLMLIKALVFPYLDYCVGIALDLSAEFTLKLSRCKNAALRFVTGTKRHEHITPVYANLQILPFTYRRQLLCLCLLASILSHQEPRYLSTQLTFRPRDRPGSKRCSSLDLYVGWARTCCRKNAFVVEIPRIWNKLPAELRALYTRPCFKTRLYQYLLRQSFSNAATTI